MDMYLTLSLGLRNPFEKYDADGQRLPVNPDGLDKSVLDNEGEFIDPESPQRFASVMYVDYIRSWKRDYENFESSKREFTDEDRQRFK